MYLWDPAVPEMTTLEINHIGIQQHNSVLQWLYKKPVVFSKYLNIRVTISGILKNLIEKEWEVLDRLGIKEFK